MSGSFSYDVHSLNKTPLTEKEFEIVNVIGDGFRSNQRQLSTHIGLSLGMTNLLLRRLVTKGYLRIKQLNRKKVEYILTPHGLSEKAKKTYNYTLKTLDSLKILKAQIQNIFRQQRALGYTTFVVLGSGDLQDLLELAAQKLADPGLRLIRINTLAEAEAYRPCILFNGDADLLMAPNGLVGINIVEALSNIGHTAPITLPVTQKPVEEVPV